MKNIKQAHTSLQCTIVMLLAHATKCTVYTNVLAALYTCYSKLIKMYFFVFLEYTTKGLYLVCSFKKHQKHKVCKRRGRGPADTQRCFYVDSTLKFGRDVVQPIFNQSRLPGSLGLTVNVDSTLNQR